MFSNNDKKKKRDDEEKKKRWEDEEKKKRKEDQEKKKRRDDDDEKKNATATGWKQKKSSKNDDDDDFYKREKAKADKRNRELDQYAWNKHDYSHASKKSECCTRCRSTTLCGKHGLGCRLCPGCCPLKQEKGKDPKCGRCNKKPPCPTCSWCEFPSCFKCTCHEKKDGTGSPKGQRGRGRGFYGVNYSP
jgi:hypothetical protein